MVPIERDDNRTGIEFRKEFRLPVNIQLKYLLLNPSDGSNELKSAVTKDISASGLLFESKEKYALDTEMQIILEMPGSSLKTLEIEGKVARLEKLSPSLNFDIGVNFTKISEAQKDEIRNRIERMNILKLLN